MYVRIDYHNSEKYNLPFDIINDLTEVHYLFDSAFKQIAFESNIKSTGFTRFIEYIDTVFIYENKKT